MARETQFYSLKAAAAQLGEDEDLIDELTTNSDNIDYGELIYVATGTDEGIRALSSRGIECVEELLDELRESPGGVAQYLEEWRADPALIAKISRSDGLR